MKGALAQSTGPRTRPRLDTAPGSWHPAPPLMRTPYQVLGHPASGRVCTARRPGDSPGPARTWGPTSSHRANIWRSRWSILSISMGFTLQTDFKFRLLRRGSWGGCTSLASAVCFSPTPRSAICAGQPSAAEREDPSRARDPQGQTHPLEGTPAKSRGRGGARKCRRGRGETGSLGPKQEVGVASEKDLPGHNGQVMDVLT